MIGYATVGSNELETSIPFFTDLLNTEGVTKVFDRPSGGVVFGKEGKLVLGVLSPSTRSQQRSATER